ncbi:hypothetical protein BpHYR1_000864 [Brachionus plicatilis]|uniref:Uncharacterized protein n=1 Tax=Brachionus plicatilis TaxID=10195 RepID=A0A3M7S3J6_BRAPC|nr:hypothetical protein BpHYR1_000864 [Brachionus plicatilis]
MQTFSYIKIYQFPKYTTRHILLFRLAGFLPKSAICIYLFIYDEQELLQIKIKILLRLVLVKLKSAKLSSFIITI